MKKLIIITLALVLNSCIFRTVDCRPYELKFEEFWMQGEIGTSTLTMKNSQDIEKTLVLKDKWIAHTSNYTSDTGCNCNDQSAQLISVGTDSIWMFTNAWYIEKNDAEFYETVKVIINGISNSFSENNLTNSSEIIGTTTISTRTYESNAVTVGAYSITFGKGLGPIRIKFRNGDFWEILNPTIRYTSPISTYRYEETICN